MAEGTGFRIGHVALQAEKEKGREMEDTIEVKAISGGTVTWNTAEGELVGEGDLLAVIADGKGRVFVHAPAAGFIEETLVDAGARVPSGEVIEAFRCAD